MSLKNELPATYKTLKPFRADFGKKVPSVYKQANWKGRVYCFIQLACSPIIIPFKIGRRVAELAHLVAGMALLIVNLVAKFIESTLKRKPLPDKGPFSSFAFTKEFSLITLDMAIAIVVSPLAIAASRIRYLAGIINPPLAFSPLSKIIPFGGALSL